MSTATREQLLAEVQSLRERLATMERAEAERRQREEALRPSHHLFQAVTEGNPDAVFAKDRDGHYLMMNANGARLLGRSPEEVLGKEDHHFFSPETVSQILQNDRQVMQTGEARTYEEICTAAGMTRDYLTTKTPYRDLQGRVVGIIGVAHDITQRKLAEAALHRSEECFRHVLENSRDGIYQLNIQTGTYDYVSPAVEQITGYRKEELVAGGLSQVAALIHPDDLEQLREHVNRLLAQTVEENIDPTIEYRFRTKHRGYRWISDSRAVVFDQHHVAAAIVGNIRDVTERKEAEEERARAVRDQAAHELIQGLDAIVCEVDAGTRRFIFVSQRAEAMLGYPVERWLGEPDFWINLIHPQDRPHTVAWCQSATAHGHDHACEYRVIGADGRVVWLHEMVRLVRGPGGEVRQLRCLMTDITQRKKVEEMLRTTQEFLTRLLEHVPAPVYVVSRDGRYRLVNRNWEEVLHRSREEVVGRPLEQVLPPELARQFLDSNRQVMDAGDPIVSEEVLDAFGRKRYFHSVKFPLRDADGQIEAMGGISIDVTDRKRAEKKLRKYTRRLQSLSRRLLDVQETERRFLAAELHDEVGQLLTALRFSLDTSTRAAGDILPTVLRRVQEQVQELTVKVRDLSLRLRPTMLDDLGLLPALLWQFERYTNQTGITVAFRHSGIDRRLTPEVETAAYRIVQESLTNVARHAGVKEVTVGLWADQNALLIQIEDQGSGFEIEAARSSHTSSGLAGMNERAMLLGGQLRIESTPGSGTCVEAELPLESRLRRRRR